MKASKFTEAQKAFILKQGEEGTSVAEICRKAGIGQSTYFAWKKRYGEPFRQTRCGQAPTRSQFFSCILKAYESFRLQALGSKRNVESDEEAIFQSFRRSNMISMRLRRLRRRLSYLKGLPRDLPQGMRTFIPLSLKAFLNHSASLPLATERHSAYGGLPNSSAAPLQSPTWPAERRIPRVRPFASKVACGLVFIPPFVCLTCSLNF